ncbi:MAG TPA: adenylosuccinate lyase [Candidatus Methylacidiphilales bacterium]|jgi:adenylosuccinate lyase|nr:adenylosuccinate lyase [Candidatus Methylacidiphilales bacterium]
MIPRYSRPEMAALWSEEAKLAHWLEIEVLACEGMAAIGAIPAEDAQIIRAKAAFDVDTVRENEKRTNHDVIAFLEDVAAHVGGPGRFIHRGLTSSDLLDTTLALQLVASANLLLEDIKQLRAAVALRAKEHKLTPMMGRSHGIHAEPITYGLKLALMYDEFGRAEKRLIEARGQIAVGKLSGAVGTHAHLDPRVEQYVCDKLGLAPAAISTQIIQRDRHAHFMSTLALIASSVDRWATEFRHLQRSEVLEVEEFFAQGQKGSSAMPHKRNPITGEKLSGLARVIRGNAVAALENVALWHERDISHSSVERIIFPDSCELLSYMLVLMADLVARQVVYAENMAANLAKSKGLIFSQTVLLALADKGLPRQVAYEAVQAASMACWRGAEPLQVHLKKSNEIRSVLSDKEIDELCSPDRHFRYINDTFRKLGLG